mmetsp:Transcript_3079/g.7077  ORF Transcript_3079/g.7077 Transcript_3079/m.7077 type:complete len:146 (-) Transcript_3079:357-794(-)
MAKSANSVLQCSEVIRGRKVPMAAPIQAGMTAEGMMCHAIADGSFCSQFKKPNIPLPKVMVATANDAPRAMCTLKRDRIGMNTMPPPTGTALASAALPIPRRGIAEADSNSSRSSVHTSSMHHSSGNTGISRKAACRWRNDISGG